MTADLNLSCSLDLGRVNFSDFIQENTTPVDNSVYRNYSLVIQ